MKLLGLLGYPVSHSFSPQMITRLARKKGWDCSYHPFSIPEKRLNDFVQAVKLLPISGFNVTIPYKEKIVAYCDELSPAVQNLGVANTIVHHQGKLQAWNTDVSGFSYGLKAILPPDFPLENVLILGAGGAARASVYALFQHGVRGFFVANRNQTRLKNWQRHFIPSFSGLQIEFLPLETRMLEKTVPNVQLVVQATPVGTWPETEECLPFPFHMLSKQHLVLDLIYNPGETEFLKRAKPSGCICENGLQMLAAQGAESLRHWGYLVTVKELRGILLELLEEKGHKNR